MHVLCGIISKDSRQNRYSQLVSMARSMQHEPFYTTRFFANPDAGVYFGLVWKGSDGPVSGYKEFDKGASVAIIAADQVWHDEEDSDEATGVPLDLASFRAEVLADSTRAVKRINGMFSGVVFDEPTDRVWVFNDRFGFHRIFMFQDVDAFYFASEAKAILAIAQKAREFDTVGVGEFLTIGATIGSRSLFSGVTILEAATLMCFERDRRCRQLQYFTPDEWKRSEVKGVAPEEGLLRSFGEAVVRCCDPHRDIAVSLTGGLDSRMVEAVLCSLGLRVPTYTFASMYRETHDVRVAKLVAEAAGQPHSSLTLDTAFLQDFTDTLQRSVVISDGYTGFIGAAELYLNRKAREIAPVRLTGDSGSEVLRGVRAFKAIAPTSGFVIPELQRVIGAGTDRFDRSCRQLDPVTFAAFFQAVHQAYGLRKVQSSQVAIRTPFLDWAFLRWVYKIGAGTLNGSGITEKTVERYSPILTQIPTDFGYLGRHGTNLARVFGRKLSFRFEYLLGRGMPPWLAAVRGVVPWLVPVRRARGIHKFAHFDYWSQNELSDSIMDLCGLAKRRLGFVERASLDGLIASHMSGRANYLTEIDRIMSLALTSELLLSDKPVSPVETPIDDLKKGKAPR